MPGEERLVEKWRRARSLLDERLGELVEAVSEGRGVEVYRYIVAGGKRLRGFTTLLVAEALGASWDEALDAAAAVELVHSASLALDDVIDGDVERRGAPAAWLRFGPGRAIMAANLLISYAQKLLMERYGLGAVERSVLAWFDISRGEVRDAYMEDGDYYEVVRLKTGSLFRLAAELGAVAAGAGRERVEALGEYGELMGVAYQLADDIVDYLRGERDGSVRRLLEWLGSPRDLVAAALERLASILSRVEEVLERLGLEAGLLSLLPRFVVKLMLGEAGVEAPVA